MTTRKTKTKEAKARQGKRTDLNPNISQKIEQGNEGKAAELQNFAHHLAEALRIARYSPMIPASLYNGLADALIDFENDLPSLSRVSESEAHILITLNAYIEQTAARAEKKGGARR
jgi:hypothetical protein